jgi:hypothetical protein
MLVKKFNQFLNENNTLTETDIREYIREELETFKYNLAVKINAKFPLDNNNLQKEDEEIINNIFNNLIDVYSKITIDNISSFDKTWIKSDDKIEAGDTVYDKETGESYFVTRFGVNNNFFDSDKSRFISLDSVSKTKN